MRQQAQRARAHLLAAGVEVPELDEGHVRDGVEVLAAVVHETDETRGTDQVRAGVRQVAGLRSRFGPPRMLLGPQAYIPY
jgi:hypothetical protein